MKKLLASLCTVVLGACGGGADNTANSTAAIFGDSITEYTDSALSTTLKVPVANLATSGETTTNAISGTKTFGGYSLKYSTFEQEIRKPYSVIYLRYGMAEAVHAYHNRTTPHIFKSNLEYMVDLVKQQNKIPVIVGVSYSFNQYEDTAILLNGIAWMVAQQTGTQFVNVRNIKAQAQDVPDGIHPTAEYGQKMIEYIAAETSHLFIK